MSPPRVRRTVAGLILAMLLATAVPAGAVDFRLARGLGLQDLWSCAWSWLMGLRPNAGRPEEMATAQANGKKTPGPPPSPPPGTRRTTNGDKGSGLDPDG